LIQFHGTGIFAPVFDGVFRRDIFSVGESYRTEIVLFAIAKSTIAVSRAENARRRSSSAVDSSFKNSSIHCCPVLILTILFMRTRESELGLPMDDPSRFADRVASNNIDQPMASRTKMQAMLVFQDPAGPCPKTSFSSSGGATLLGRNFKWNRNSPITTLGLQVRRGVVQGLPHWR
jgi:hypothetical protein